MAFHIVLVEPEIPQNTGNIVRTCAVTGSFLHLVKPLGFSIEDRYLKRAGLDYWKSAQVKVYENIQEVWDAFPQGSFYYASTKAKKTHAEPSYADGSIFVFGKETAGLPEEIIYGNYERAIRIPMREGERSLNLSNSVAIVLYEALRQQGFPNLN
jgi:tRNA (cytidine/uridine-2'-O-)-methyltransferase